MKLDYDRALAILEEETQASLAGELDELWVARVRAVCDAIEEKGKTIIAALGTAMLAKATDLGADPFALKVGDGAPGAYSARALCKDVLAAHAPRLRLDLGVSGREPLNNQPFVGEARIAPDLPVHSKSRPAFDLLLGVLGQLAALGSEPEARAALRAFLYVRAKPELAPEEVELGGLRTWGALSEALAKFAAEDAEGGKRAQAAVAAVLDAVYGAERVCLARINDPDRRFPCDVGVLARAPEEGREPPALERVFEVRQKPVLDTDLHHMIGKVAQRGVSRAAMLALAARGQGALDLGSAESMAAGAGVTLRVYVGWRGWLDECAFWCPAPEREAVARVNERVFARAKQIEVSLGGLHHWVRLSTSEEASGGELGE